MNQVERSRAGACRRPECRKVTTLTWQLTQPLTREKVNVRVCYACVRDYHVKLNERGELVFTKHNDPAGVQKMMWVKPPADSWRKAPRPEKTKETSQDPFGS